MGFEPTLGYKPKHAFQACALNHSATSPLKRIYPRLAPWGLRQAHAYLKMFVGQGPTGSAP